MRRQGYRDSLSRRRMHTSSRLAGIMLAASVFLLTITSPASAGIGVRYENPEYGMAGVKATVSSTGWAYTLGPSTGYKLVKLTNQWGSGRQFTAGLKRASYTGFPDDEINLYLNLQIRRGSNSPTLLDWYLGPWQHGEETVYIPEIRNPYAGNSTSYELRLNSQLFGVYSWYTIDGNVAGTWATANRYTAAGAHFRNIRVYDDYYQLGDYYWMRQYASQYPDVYFVYDEPPRPGTTTWGVINPSYEWSCQSIL